MAAVEGKNVLVEALRVSNMGTLYVPLLCSTSIEFNYDTELIETASPTQGFFKEFVGGIGEWSISLSGVTHCVQDNGAYTVFDTLLESIRKNGLDIRLSYEDKSSNLQVITGHVLIPHTGITSPEDGFSEDSIDLKGDGAFALSTTIINPGNQPFDVLKIDATLSGGETFVTYPALINTTLLYVGFDGVGQEVVTGTPAPLQVKFTASTGKIEWPDAVPQGLWLHIIYKK